MSFETGPQLCRETGVLPPTARASEMRRVSMGPGAPGAARRVVQLVLVCVALVFSGCGASYYSYEIVTATRVVEQARQASAPELAPYEFVLAESYLSKAREEGSSAEYLDAIDLAREARAAGNKAIEISRRRRQSRGDSR